MLSRASLLLRPEAMHIPDGFLSPPVAAVGWLLAFVAIWYALRKTRLQLGERQVPLLGVLAAFIFAAQAINFPVAAGTSGHLLGGALAAIVLGPWAAVLVMTAVVGLQGFLFQDGGLLVMGWNLVNMAVLTPLSGWLVFTTVRRLVGKGRSGYVVATAAAAWFSVEAGAAATALELAASGTAALTVTLSAMLGVHALVGLGESVISVGAIGLILGARPDLLATSDEAPGGRSASVAAVGLLTALIVAVLSLFASQDPDGLERVATDLGFAGRAASPGFQILPDYTLPALGDAAVGSVLAVVIGVLILFALLLLLGRRWRRQGKQ